MRSLIITGLRDHIRRILIASVFICSMIFFSMQFFPAIAENAGLLDQFFSSGIMNQLLLAFGIDVAAMTSVLGFYATYTSMFVVLIGSVFFAGFAYNLLAGEERSGTIEYLAVRPLTRGQILGGRLAVLMIMILVFGLILSGTGWLALEGAKQHGRPYLVISEFDDHVEEAVMAESLTVSAWLTQTEDDFNQLMLAVISVELAAGGEELNELDLDMAWLEGSLDEILRDPEAFFEEVMENPAEYLALMRIPDMDAESFRAEAEKSLNEYRAVREEFLAAADQVQAYFSLSPEYYLQRVLDSGKADEFTGLLRRQGVNAELYQVYEISIFFILQLNMILAITAMSCLGFAFAAVTDGKRTSSQAVLLFVIAAYFLNTFTQLSPDAHFLSYLSPFAYFDLAVNHPDFGVHAGRLLSVGAFTGAVLALAARMYGRKDF